MKFQELLRNSYQIDKNNSVQMLLLPSCKVLLDANLATLHIPLSTYFTSYFEANSVLILVNVGP